MESSWVIYLIFKRSFVWYKGLLWRDTKQPHNFTETTQRNELTNHGMMKDTPSAKNILVIYVQYHTMAYRGRECRDDRDPNTSEIESQVDLTIHCNG